MMHKNEIARPVAQGFYYILVVIVGIFLLASIIAPASALTEEVTLEDTYASSSGSTMSGGVAANSWGHQMTINSAVVTQPSHYVWYFFRGSGPAYAVDTPFNMYYGGNTVGTGTAHFRNGTFMAGTYNHYMDLEFTSTDFSTLGGGSVATTVYFEDAAINASGPMPGSGGTYGADMCYRSGSGNWCLLGYHHVYNYNYARQNWLITNTSPISNTMLFEYELDRTGYSTPKIFSNNTVIYTSPVQNTDLTGLLIGPDLILQMYVPASGRYINSSLLFQNYQTDPGAIPTPTPTPTTTGVPSGYITTYFQCVDGKDNGAIYGCNLNLHDEFNNTWTNVTNDSDGTHKITTHSGATVGGYSTASGYAATTRTGLTPFDGIYELIMWPSDSVCTTPGSCGTVYDPGLGSINLLISVNDGATGSGISGATVKLVESSGSTLYGSTNQAGVEEFMMTNETTFRIVVEADGYQTASKMHTTSAFGPDSVRIELSKSYATVTPTVVITDVSGNVVQTIDTRSASVKDQAMMDKLRDAGPGILDLVILGITVFILMGILGAFGVRFN